MLAVVEDDQRRPAPCSSSSLSLPRATAPTPRSNTPRCFTAALQGYPSSSRRRRRQTKCGRSACTIPAPIVPTPTTPIVVNSRIDEVASAGSSWGASSHAFSGPSREVPHRIVAESGPTELPGAAPPLVSALAARRSRDRHPHARAATSSAHPHERVTPAPPARSSR